MEESEGKNVAANASTAQNFADANQTQSNQAKTAKINVSEPSLKISKNSSNTSIQNATIASLANLPGGIDFSQLLKDTGLAQLLIKI